MPVLGYLFNKVAGLKACKVIKRDSNTVNIAKFLIPIFKKTCELLLLP